MLLEFLGEEPEVEFSLPEGPRLPARLLEWLGSEPDPVEPLSWPPQSGDVWRLTEAGEPETWAAIGHRSGNYVTMFNACYVRGNGVPEEISVAVLLERAHELGGPLRLEYRRPDDSSANDT